MDEVTKNCRFVSAMIWQSMQNALVIRMSIAPFSSDAHLLKFAKWFFQNRLETFRKDIAICMTPNSRGSTHISRPLYLYRVH
jgi:hypothetical protein